MIQPYCCPGPDQPRCRVCCPAVLVHATVDSRQAIRLGGVMGGSVRILRRRPRHRLLSRGLLRQGLLHQGLAEKQYGKASGEHAHSVHGGFLLADFSQSPGHHKAQVFAVLFESSNHFPGSRIDTPRVTLPCPRCALEIRNQSIDLIEAQVRGVVADCRSGAQRPPVTGTNRVCAPVERGHPGACAAAPDRSA